ncbi:hypothetical protein GCM10007874_37190 [Labrys miyagiensis]|uniref:Trypsin-like peptidase domain-containing protein n=1 Tax=Labrys miyagiensis TaxID=346912 RepID=A0ABQ6CK10_9HYPH|nr:hypothetical protein [Labrys miyagiensis]GLS20702.1 hypothetical protein GCM10007874_37190 [Labrys miyagiensis]
MTSLLDAISDQLSHFAIGLVERVEGAGSKVLGSGVLVSIEGRRGILTCGHVAEQYEARCDIGLVRLIAGTQKRQIIDITDAHHIIVHSSDNWTEGDLDLAFTFLNPEVADSIATQSVFLNAEKNRTKIEGGEPTVYSCVDVMFGLVAEYSEAPAIEGGKFVSPMRAVLYSGKMHSDKNALLRFQTTNDDPNELPKDFGGLSGSGLWRIHFMDHGDGKFEIIHKQLWGIASWQIDKQNNKGAVAGQAWDRIDQALIPCVRDKLQL